MERVLIKGIFYDERSGIMMEKIVVKFGGSSLASAEQFKKVGSIIKENPARRYVVPSAPGKRFSDDTKVTDMLYACYSLAEEGKNFSEQLKAIKARYDEIIKGLSLSLVLDKEFAKIESEFKAHAGKEYAASRGEYLNGMIMAAYLEYEFVDSAEVIFFDENGTFLSEETNKALSERLANVENAVIPGFYGSIDGKKVKTFSRGGSDITGSLVAKAVDANLYENWTDVSGFLVADPRIIRNPKVITMITYKELRELSYMGATVLHEDAIFPVRKAGIPINIRNTNEPSAPGTMIVANTCHTPEYTITGIAGVQGFVAVNIEKDMMNAEIGFGRKALAVFEKYGVSFEHTPSGIDTMSILVNQKDFEGKEQQILAELQKETQADSIELHTNLALIAVVGRGMKSTRGTAGRIFAALAHANVNIKMIDQGSSELNIIIGVENEDFKTAIKSIYDIFVTSQI